MTQQDSLARRALFPLVFVVGALAGFFFPAGRNGDPDMFWHLATGRWIVQNGSIPTTDVFSWWGIENARPWTSMEWLFDTIMYGVYRAGELLSAAEPEFGGYLAVYAMVGLLEGCLALLFYAVGRARGLSSVWSLALTFVGLMGTMMYLVPRPQMATYCLLLLMMLLLEKKRFVAALAVIVLGVNLHGGMWVVYVGIYAFYALPANWKMIGAALLAAGINPHPLGTYAYPFLVYLQGSTAQIQEYTPTAVWALATDRWTYLLTGALVAARRTSIPVKEALFAGAFFVLSLTGVRHIVWMYLFVVPVLAPWLVATAESLGRDAASALAAWRARSRGAEAQEEPASQDAPEPASEAGRPGVRFEALVAALLVVAAVGLAVANVRLVTVIGFDPETYYPVAMVDFLKKNDIERTFTTYDEGGFLIWKGYAPLIDGRFDPFVAHFPGDKDLMADYTAVMTFQTDPPAMLREYGITHLMIRKGPLAISLQHNPAMEILAATNTHVLFRYDVAADASVEPTGPAGSIESSGSAPASGTP